MLHFHLQADGSDGLVFALDFSGSGADGKPVPLPTAPANSHVRVEYSTIIESEHGATLQVKAPVTVLQRGRSLAGLDGVSFSVQPTILVMLVDFCGKNGGAAATQEVSLGPPLASPGRAALARPLADQCRTHGHRQTAHPHFLHCNSRRTSNRFTLQRTTT